jgi:hypothetical protein
LPPPRSRHDDERYQADPRSAPNGATEFDRAGSPDPLNPSAEWQPRPAAFGNPQRRRLRAFATVGRLLTTLGVVLALSAAAFYWLRLRDVAQLASAPEPVQPSAARPGSAATPKPAGAAPAETIPPRPGFPLPSTFGIYALSEGQLAELKPIQGKVPDQRVAMSAAINTPSQTTLPKGDAKFIVFRRDAATNAADRADVRMVAKVARAMGVDASGKAVVSQADSWVIRNISFPYKIGPVEDHPEMYLVQPEAADLVLAPGRYVLVIKGLGYDFTVAGAITDPRQCVERFDAVNGAFYSPCPGK